MKNKYIKISVILIVTVGVVATFYFYWRENSAWRAAREEQKQYAAAEAFMSRYDAAMKADTYGGKTPQETLQLLIAALEKGDIDLAAKYFMLETNENNPDYLTRKKWEEALKATAKAGILEKSIDTVRNSKPYIKDNVGEDDYKFISYNANGDVVAYINMQFNNASGVWKVESL